MTLMLNTYTVTVMATHVVLEVYVIRSELSYNDILEDLKGDPFKLYSGDEVRMVEDEFLECQRLNLLDVEETPNA
jgi:hypothetical protein